MKAVILAGGLGTRLAEETHLRPKPMVEVGGKPILWHILKTYSYYGINEFIICCGYKGFMIKEYFANYFLHTSDVTFHIDTNQIEIHKQNTEPWKVTLVDTGETTMTGGRLARVREYLDDTFCFTYGDGVADVNIEMLVEHHRLQKRKPTLTAVQPPGRYGALCLKGNPNNTVQETRWRRWMAKWWIFRPLSHLLSIWSMTTVASREQTPLNTLASNGELSAYMHKSFWHPMDTLRDRQRLEELWVSGQAPWKVWS